MRYGMTTDVQFAFFKDITIAAKYDLMDRQTALAAQYDLHGDIFL